MKRVLLVLLVLSITVGTVAATKRLPVPVRDVVERALENERVAAARYVAYAAKADEDGYPGAAALFRAQARAERTHAERFLSLLRSDGGAIPPEPATAPCVDAPDANLRAAASAERSERDGIYREAIDVCKLNNAADVAKIFDETRDTEVEHANLCNAATRDLQSMKTPKAFYVCGRCGYTTDVKLPFCPACQHKEAPATVE
jgi:rubrerythrin